MSGDVNMLGRWAAWLGLAIGLVAAPLGGASAQEGMAFKNLMGSIGIIPKEKDPIRYRERAPLVIPPKAELRPPSASGLAAANPQWPNDPDVVEKRRRADEERRPVTWSETRRMSGNNVTMSPDELRAGRSATSTAPTPGSHRGDNARDVLLMSPDQLRGGARTAAAAEPAGEPTRRVLTDPPTGMRRSATGRGVATDFTPRVDQQALDANPMNWLTQRFRGGDDD